MKVRLHLAGSEGRQSKASRRGCRLNHTRFVCARVKRRLALTNTRLTSREMKFEESSRRRTWSGGRGDCEARTGVACNLISSFIFSSSYIPPDSEPLLRRGSANLGHLLPWTLAPPSEITITDICSPYLTPNPNLTLNPNPSSVLNKSVFSLLRRL